MCEGILPPPSHFYHGKWPDFAFRGAEAFESLKGGCWALREELAEPKRLIWSPKETENLQGGLEPKRVFKIRGGEKKFTFTDVLFQNLM